MRRLALSIALAAAAAFPAAAAAQERHDVHVDGFPEESLEEWHRRHGVLDGEAPG